MVLHTEVVEDNQHTQEVITRLAKPSSSSSSQAQSNQLSSTAANAFSFSISSANPAIAPQTGNEKPLLVKLLHHMITHLLQEDDLGHKQVLLISDIEDEEDSVLAKCSVVWQAVNTRSPSQAIKLYCTKFQRNLFRPGG